VKHEIIREEFSPEKVAQVQALWQAHKQNLSEYIDRLMWWNKRVNLISRDVSRETITHHVEHSLVVAQSGFFKEGGFVIDSGTGGGLPGIPLAITHPLKQIMLNDIVSKKIMACKHIASGIGLKNISSSAASIKEVEIPEGAVVVSKHAFKVNDLIGLLGKNPWGAIVLLKGGAEVEEELEGVDEALSIKVVDLEKGFNHSFYEGKAMVEITKQ
jgi:16S rRNA (guanine527-N7)-methyltransferase